MRPIVDGISEQYTGQVAFIDLNARDGDTGQQAFEALSLAGHPSFIVVSVEGEECYRAVGVVEASELAAELDAALSDTG